MRKTAVTAGLLALIAHAVAQNRGQERTPQNPVSYPPRLEGARAEVYKKIGATELNIYAYEPPNHKSTDRTPAIVFFFGGGWNAGSPAQFEQQCRYLASRGMVAMTADYRVASRHAAKVVDCIGDAKSAVRWIRTNAARLGIDPNRIAAGGGSAGAHIAAAAANIRDFDEPIEDRSTSSVPNALVLFNPPAALAPYGDQSPFDSPEMSRLADRFGSDPQAISPAHHVRPGAPPAILFFGTADRLLGGAEYFCKEMKQKGGRCELVTYEDQPHGFFNFGRSQNKYFLDTLKKADAFLVSLGYLKGEPTVDQFAWKVGG